MGPYIVSALADPDVGIGTFIFQVDLREDGIAPAGTNISLWVEPEDGHLPRSPFYLAERTLTRRGERWIAKVPFDAQGMWRIGIRVEGPAGTGETELSVRVTPPGPSPLVSLACLVPFGVLGVIWMLGARRAARSKAPSPSL